MTYDIIDIVYFSGVVLVPFTAMVLYHLGYDVFELKRDDDGRGLLFAILATGAWPLFLVIMVIGAAFLLVLTLMLGASKLVADAIKALLPLG